MRQLKESGRTNILYSLARSLATARGDGTGTKFPTTRMPMGLLEYTVGFFDSDNLQEVGTNTEHTCVQVLCTYYFCT